MVLSWANEDAVWGNYIVMRLWVETNAAVHCSLAQVMGLSYNHVLFHGRRYHMHHSVAPSPLAVSGVRDHNIISRQEGTCWWNMHEAEGHWTGVDICTNTAIQNDWLPQRACCEKSIWHSNPFYPPPVKCCLTSLHAPLPGGFKMYNH